MHQKATIATFEDTLVYMVDPGRRITPGACKQFQIVSGPANARNLNFIPKRAKAVVLDEKGLKWLKRRAKQCAFSEKMVVLRSKKVNF